MSLRGLVIGVVALASLATGAAAQAPGWLENGAPAKPDPSRATAGDLAVMQIATPDPEGLMAAWNRPGAGVKVTTAHKIARNKPIVTFVVFRGCRADAAGACNLTADFEVIDPQGKAYASDTGVKIWVGYPPPPGQSIELSEGGLGLMIEDKDPLGVYLVRATITDHVSGAVLRTESPIEATAK